LLKGSELSHLRVIIVKRVMTMAAFMMLLLYSAIQS
jgi:hypothetical protein